MNLNIQKLFSITFTCFGLFTCTTAKAQDLTPPKNIALGKKVILDTKPNYKWCTDPDDDKQLTDGRYSSLDNVQEKENTTAIWVQKGTVGWTGVNPAIMTIDLGSTQPISGVSYSTAAGVAGVTWPVAIYMAVSDDNKSWRPIGDLVRLSHLNGTTPKPREGYQTFRYTAHSLKVTGRYLAFGVTQPPYTFVDEIEVYKGNDAWLALPPKEQPTYPSIRDYISKMAITISAQRRLDDDIIAIRQLIQKSAVSSAHKSTFEERLTKDAEAAADMMPLPRDFKTILPLNDIHRDILAVHGELLAAEGLKQLTVWKQHRYAWLPLLAKPQAHRKISVDFSMLKNQFRSDNLLLTNASGQLQNVKLELNDLPQKATAGWLQLYSVEWTDTLKGIPVASALMPVQPVNGVYTVQVPAGMTRKVWITIDSSKIPPGEYKSTFTIFSKGQQSIVPFSLNVSRIAMAKPRLSLGVWDYTNSPNPKGFDGITPQNKQAAIALMHSHFVNTPWGTMGAIPIPGKDGFNSDGTLKQELDFSNLDQWIRSWKGAKQYFVYLAVPDSIAGFPMGTQEFNVRVGSWAKALSQHMKSLDLKPQQLGLLLVDEPGTDAQDAIIAAWAKAINATAPGLTLFSDLVWLRPDQTKIQDAITEMDVLCPPLGNYVRGNDKVQKYFQELRAQGKELWFYGTSGPSRLMNPQQYYRYQAWQAFSAGATGEGYWAFGSLGGAPTSWNAYSETSVSYSPVFIDKVTLYDSVQWNANREGIEDYEVLAMLRDAIAASHNTAWKNQAQQVLDTAVKAVTDTWNGDYNWAKETDPHLADAQIRKVQAMLIKN